MNKRPRRKPRKQDKTRNPSGKGRLFRIIKRTVLISLVAVALVAGTTFFLVRSEPAHWKQHQQFLAETSPKQIEVLAGQVEDQLKELANLGIEEAQGNQESVTSWVQSLTRPGDTPADGEASPQPVQTRIKPEDVRINAEQTITLNNEQLAAVMQTRMDEWIQERGYSKPEEILDPMVAIQKGQFVMAFQLQSGPFSAVISGKFTLNIMDNGMAELTLNRFLVGKLPVPADALGEHLRKSSGGDERAAQVGEWLGKLQYLQVKPVLELEHRRRARVMDYKIHSDGLELQVRIQDHKTYKSMNNALADVPTY